MEGRHPFVAVSQDITCRGEQGHGGPVTIRPTRGGAREGPGAGLGSQSDPEEGGPSVSRSTAQPALGSIRQHRPHPQVQRTSHSGHKALCLQWGGRAEQQERGCVASPTSLSLCLSLCLCICLSHTQTYN